ncbi:MAG: hypothetical protein COY42_00360 [Armatimonadetes bacterium CG_4_10_14_0_8_um_filter_66_14]|nr:MAG: hypothetical protein COY42_00360 [Armatimonadetes bacterium CG_4_10_14_0_8_um_filter_66_14]PJB68885.1 MAG: hypothetical protein CO096_14010 [Armatimonadetes bacterium CG_4_9_14_3_um_filter_66_14]
MIKQGTRATLQAALLLLSACALAGRAQAQFDIRLTSPDHIAIIQGVASEKASIDMKMGGVQPATLAGRIRWLTVEDTSVLTCLKVLSARCPIPIAVLAPDQAAAEALSTKITVSLTDVAVRDAVEELLRGVGSLQVRPEAPNFVVIEPREQTSQKSLSDLAVDATAHKTEDLDGALWRIFESIGVRERLGGNGIVGVSPEANLDNSQGNGSATRFPLKGGFETADGERLAGVLRRLSSVTGGYSFILRWVADRQKLALSGARQFITPNQLPPGPVEERWRHRYYEASLSDRWGADRCAFLEAVDSLSGEVPGLLYGVVLPSDFADGPVSIKPGSCATVEQAARALCKQCGFASAFERGVLRFTPSDRNGNTSAADRDLLAHRVPYFFMDGRPFGSAVTFLAAKLGMGSQGPKGIYIAGGDKSWGWIVGEPVHTSGFQRPLIDLIADIGAEARMSWLLKPDPVARRLYLSMCENPRLPEAAGVRQSPPPRPGEPAPRPARKAAMLPELRKLPYWPVKEPGAEGTPPTAVVAALPDGSQDVQDGLTRLTADGEVGLEELSAVSEKHGLALTRSGSIAVLAAPPKFPDALQRWDDTRRLGIPQVLHDLVAGLTAEQIANHREGRCVPAEGLTGKQQALLACLLPSYAIPMLSRGGPRDKRMQPVKVTLESPGLGFRVERKVEIARIMLSQGTDQSQTLCSLTTGKVGGGGSGGRICQSPPLAWRLRFELLGNAEPAPHMGEARVSWPQPRALAFAEVIGELAQKTGLELSVERRAQDRRLLVWGPDILCRELTEALSLATLMRWRKVADGFLLCWTVGPASRTPNETSCLLNSAIHERWRRLASAVVRPLEEHPVPADIPFPVDWFREFRCMPAAELDEEALEYVARKFATWPEKLTGQGTEPSLIAFYVTTHLALSVDGFAEHTVPLYL